MGSLKLRALTPEDVRAEWPWIKAGIERVVAKTSSKFMPEDVYLRLQTKTAWAYAIADFGGVIFTLEHDPDGPVLYVWLLWILPGYKAPNADSFYAQMVTLAKEVKAKRIRMQSPRLGWEKEKFFTKVAVVYEHEL